MQPLASWTLDSVLYPVVSNSNTLTPSIPTHELFVSSNKNLDFTFLRYDDDFDGATSVYAVDIDGDLDADVVGSAWHDNEIALWRNEGGNPPIWMKYTIKSDFDFAHEVYCHDLDLDGDIDILGASSDDNQIAWWRNNGDQPIIWTEQIICDDFYGAKSVRVEDIDNDGLLDVIGAAIIDDKIIWYKWHKRRCQ